MDKLTNQQEDMILEEQMEIYRKKTFWKRYKELITPEEKISHLYLLADDFKHEIVNNPNTRHIAIALSKYLDDIIDSEI